MTVVFSAQVKMVVLLQSDHLTAFLLDSVAQMVEYYFILKVHVNDISILNSR